jgi:hypothetical protein
MRESRRIKTMQRARRGRVTTTPETRAASRPSKTAPNTARKARVRAPSPAGITSARTKAAKTAPATAPRKASTGKLGAKSAKKAPVKVAGSAAASARTKAIKKPPPKATSKAATSKSATKVARKAPGKVARGAAATSARTQSAKGGPAKTRAKPARKTSVKSTAQTFCGSSGAYITEIQQGFTRQKIFHGPTVFFTDAVVFIKPPFMVRLKRAAAVLIGAGAGGEHGLDQITGILGKSKEQQVVAINQRLALALNRYGHSKITSTDVAAEFRDWAELWPNSRVVRATMRTKGLLVKRQLIALTPQSGFKRTFEAPREAEQPLREALSKAFGARFSEP